MINQGNPTVKTSPYRETDCDKCRKPCLSPNADYYAISQIRYCRPQLFFLIENLDLLQDGIYPDAHIETGYTDNVDPCVQRQVSHGTGFVDAALIYADVSSRLRACRRDGQTLEHEIKIVHLDYYEILSPAAKSALNYISGWRRRKMRYSVWLAKQKKLQELKRER